MVNAAKKACDINVASFFFMKLLPPKNGTPAVEKKTDKKGRTYLTLHVRDCAGGGTYICNVFNNNGLADKVLSLNGGKGLSEDDTFLVTGSFSAYGSGMEIKKALRATTIIRYDSASIPFSGIAGDGNDISYSRMRVRPISQTGEAVFRFTTKQGNTAVKFCVQEDSSTGTNTAFTCIAFGHVAEKVIGLRLLGGDFISVRGSLHKMSANGRELFKITETPMIISRTKSMAERKEERLRQKAEGMKVEEKQPEPVTLSGNIPASTLGGRSFG